VSLPQLKTPGYTIEEWKAWEGRWELISGVAYDMKPAPSVEHQRVSRRLLVSIESALQESRRRGRGEECEVLHAPVDLFLPNQESVLQPDLLVVCDPSKVAAHGIVGAPDLVVEILSPSTASKDTVRKRWIYEAAGVLEYLIVDPDEQFGLLLRLQGVRYEEAARVEWGSVVAILGGNLSVTLG
jgi:Uma2 family endonuclease